jgi:hypothetical protein
MVRPYEILIGMDKTTKQALKGAKGRRREEHFANGGTLTAWRGGNAVRITNKKREADRKACRRWSE